MWQLVLKFCYPLPAWKDTQLILRFFGTTLLHLFRAVRLRIFSLSVKRNQRLLQALCQFLQLLGQRHQFAAYCQLPRRHCRHFLCRCTGLLHHRTDTTHRLAKTCLENGQLRNRSRRLTQIFNEVFHFLAYSRENLGRFPHRADLLAEQRHSFAHHLDGVLDTPPDLLRNLRD